MQVTYKGTYPIKFLSEGFCGVVKPGDSIEMTDELYNKEYKNDARWQGGSSYTRKKYKKEIEE